MIAKIMVTFAILATIGVCQSVPAQPPQSALPGVFIPADALKSFEESARQNNPPVQANAAAADQNNPTQSILNQPNQAQQNPVSPQNELKPAPPTQQQQWLQQPVTNQQQQAVNSQRQWTQQPAFNQQIFAQQPVQQQYIQEPRINLQPQGTSQQQWIQQTIPNQQQQSLRWVQQPLMNQPQLVQSTAVNQLQVQPQILPNQQQILVAGPLQNQQQLYDSSQNGVPNQQTILVSQPNQLLVSQPNNIQPLFVASAAQPNQNLLIQNGQPGIGSNAIIGQVVSPVDKPVQNNLYKLVPLNNQNVANNPTDGNTYLVPVQRSIIVNQG
ncbi:snake venom metalloprotease inhibitor 02A10-like [Plodia interpunctella]|uniref:snake venom metalloprotease inhibitor 02A10-like n=1 Tax=Plodia interpunctella TaxID=58824 RepID=UPI002368482D|nr:snake venom metalloprotease inhibitor 02A10-like [Plodia interpunctella]